MKINNIFVVIFLLLPLTMSAQVDIFKGTIAASLNTVTLYADTTFIRHSNISYPAGELFTVIGQSTLEHEDDAQNQKFHWYQVSAPDGKKGWIFGDGIAVIMPEKEIPSMLQGYHKKRQSFNYGFENSVTWVATVQGRDNFHAQDYLNPIYNELYVIITNQNKKSVHIGVAGVSARGEYELNQLVFRDVTGDGATDVIIEKNHSTAQVGEVIKSVEIYTFRAGNIAKVIDESLNVKFPVGLNIPTLYKFVEIDDQTVRIEYLQFSPLKNHAPNIKNTVKINLNIATYNWNERSKTYESLYGETTIAPRGKIAVNNSFLLKTPQPNAATGIYINSASTFQVLEQVDNKSDESYFLVKTDNGQRGYLPTEEVMILDGMNGAQLLQFHQQKPVTLLNNYVEILKKAEKL